MYASLPYNTKPLLAYHPNLSEVARATPTKPVGCHRPLIRNWPPLSYSLYSPPHRHPRLTPNLRYAPRLSSDSHASFLAPTGRQSTDGGKQRAAPGHGSHNKSPLLGEGQGWGQFVIHHSSFIIGSGVWRLAGGYASLTPVCILPPHRGFSSSASANPSSSEEDMCRAWKSWERSVLWMVVRKGMCSRLLALVAFDRIVA